MKNIKYLVLIILAAIAVYFFLNKKSSTLRSEDSDFSVEDTASVTKLFLADQQGRQVLLERINESKWTVNNKYVARQDAINMLLETIKRISVKAPVNKAAFENVVKQISSTSTKIEIYQGGKKPSKVYYVGNSNQEHSGTYMLLENSTRPFLMHITGFRGYLTPRYFINENEWRDRGVFMYQYGEISSIKVEIPMDDDNSFEIKEVSPNIFSLTALKTGKNIADFDTSRVLEYITYYKNIQYEGIEETKTEEQINGVKNTTPLHIYTVTDKNGNVKKVVTFLKPMPKGATDPEGNEIFFDVDRFYAYIDDTDFVVVQYLIFDKLDKKLNDFLK